MKIIFALFFGIFALPRILQNSNGNLRTTLGVQIQPRRVPGMTVAAMRAYFQQRRWRGAAERRRNRQILNQYFQRRDQMN